MDHYLLCASLDSVSLELARVLWAVQMMYMTLLQKHQDIRSARKQILSSFLMLLALEDRYNHISSVSRRNDRCHFCLSLLLWLDSYLHYNCLQHSYGDLTMISPTKNSKHNH